MQIFKKPGNPTDESTTTFQNLKAPDATEALRAAEQAEREERRRERERAASCCGCGC